MRSAKKEGKLMSIVTILSILVSSMIVYAAPLIFTVSEGISRTRWDLVTLVWKESWLEAFSGIIFNWLLSLP